MVCPKSSWNFPLCASIALKINKNGLEAKKLWPLEVGGVNITENSQSNISEP
jgi:hypothetical protein